MTKENKKSGKDKKDYEKFLWDKNQVKFISPEKLSEEELLAYKKIMRKKKKVKKGYWTMHNNQAIFKKA